MELRHINHSEPVNNTLAQLFINNVFDVSPLIVCVSPFELIVNEFNTLLSVLIKQKVRPSHGDDVKLNVIEPPEQSIKYVEKPIDPPSSIL